MIEEVDTSKKAIKSKKAFKTISEVASDLELPQHVLRFWESKFSQIKPMKRGGNRRYYRPEDVEILKTIRKLLHTDGFTIRGAQKLIKEQGLRQTIDSVLFPDSSHSHFHASQSEGGSLIGSSNAESSPAAAVPHSTETPNPNVEEYSSQEIEMPASLLARERDALEFEAASAYNKGDKDRITIDVDTYNNLLNELKRLRSLLS